MPWTPDKATKFTKRADSAAKRSTWSKVANRELRDSGDDGRAIRIANAVVKRPSRNDQRKDQRRDKRGSNR